LLGPVPFRNVSEVEQPASFSYYRLSQLMKTRHAERTGTPASKARGASSRFLVWIEAHDRHPTWTGLALVGVPLTILVALFGQPPLGLNLLHYFGLMGPTCGMTRGVMWFARGDLARAWAFNPASVLVLPTVALLLVRAAYGRLTGRWISVSFPRRRWLVMATTLVVILLTVRQQLNAAFLLENPAG
jgi:hypothetical protein